MSVFPALCRSLGLPEPEPEHKFHPRRRWRLDWAFVAEKVAVEVEGGIWTGGRHVRGKGFLDDMEKYNEAVVRGWSVIRVTPEQMNDGTVFSLLKRLLKDGQG